MKKYSFLLLFSIIQILVLSGCSTPKVAQKQKSERNPKYNYHNSEKNIFPEEVIYIQIFDICSSFGPSDNMLGIEYVIAMILLDKQKKIHIWKKIGKVLDEYKEHIKPRNEKSLLGSEYHYVYHEIYPQIRRLSYDEVVEYEYINTLAISRQPNYEYIKKGWSVKFDFIRDKYEIIKKDSGIIHSNRK